MVGLCFAELGCHLLTEVSAILSAIIARPQYFRASSSLLPAPEGACDTKIFAFE